MSSSLSFKLIMNHTYMSLLGCCFQINISTSVSKSHSKFHKVMGYFADEISKLCKDGNTATVTALVICSEVELT